jgi:GNAT superfamily N-acetyltransferase
MEEEPDSTIQIRIAVAADVKYVYPILEEMERSARARGTGIARRTPQSLCQKIYEGKAVIAIAVKGVAERGSKGVPVGMANGGTNGLADGGTDRGEGEEWAMDGMDRTDGGVREEWAGFSYIETWTNGEFVSNSGLIVNPAYRQAGVATAIKKEIFALSRRRYPGARIFSITTGAAVMRLNHKLGFEPVTYSEITRDERFWDQCRHCVNHSILESNQRQLCLCTAMLFTPERAGGSDTGRNGRSDTRRALRLKESVAG